MFDPFVSGIYTFNVVPILGNPVFDWFFNLIMIFGVVALSIGWLINLISRS